MNQVAGTWNAPMDSGRGDPVVGVTEWGQPIYRSVLGHTYWKEQPTPAIEANRPKVSELMRGYQGDYATTRTPPQGYSQPGVMDALGAAGGWLLDGITAPGRALQGEPIRNGEVMNAALDWGLMSAPMSAPKGALRAGGMADDGPKGIKAYHGSPHDFDRFSMDKIGTGEGAQAYGHGLYFADSEGVARSYRDALANRKYMTGDGPSPLKTAWSIVGGSSDRAKMPTDDILQYVKNAWPNVPDDEIRAAINEAKAAFSPGRMYEVNIKANPDDFLDWDAPLNEQPHIQSLVPGVNGKGRDAIDRLYTLESDPIHDAFRRGELPMEEYQRSNPNVQVTDRLREAGIPGIKYYDGMSRGTGKGTRNYVVFDENLIEIMRKYGLGGVGFGLLGGMWQPDGKQQ